MQIWGGMGIKVLIPTLIPAYLSGQLSEPVLISIFLGFYRIRYEYFCGYPMGMSQITILN